MNIKKEIWYGDYLVGWIVYKDGCFIRYIWDSKAYQYYEMFDAMRKLGG